MAQQAKVYDEIYDYHFSQAAPEVPLSPSKTPEVGEQQRTHLRRLEDTKQKREEERKRKLKVIALQVIAVVSVMAAFIAMALNSERKKNEAIDNLAVAKSNYEHCIEENNQLKEELNAFMSKVDIDKIAAELGLQKVAKGNEVYIDEGAATE